MASQISGTRVAQSMNSVGQLVTHMEQNKINPYLTSDIKINNI